MTLMESTPKISFVIPAYNERRYLPNTLEAIRQHAPPGIAYEIIVVDHGSGDGTPKIAESFGAKVFHQHGGTIGGLRNRGVAFSKGDVIVFLDADVRLTADWGREIARILDTLASSLQTLTGSYSDLPENAGWLQRSWYGPGVSASQGDYLPTQHLIVSREAFGLIGGFDESLETGEDFDFCRRASANGFVISPDPRLRVIHDGYPDDVRAFVRREVWHGRGDFTNFSTIIRSKIALAAILFITLHVALVTTILLANFKAAATMLFAVAALTFAGSMQRFRRAGMLAVLRNIPVLYLYLAGRAISWMQVLMRPQAIKRTRESPSN